ncbi:Alpha/Beta hydrolase protein [Mycena albidolilacea]|uniref:Alpha/Beta hydrolase protein n=1 Tax=Mycena albidolilacea TaxID=1033008 RepID=A0AAD6Z9Z5_9AGAR|nr:Alpha/Beta hydrolase protein [Mycena albidolilacea]
MPLFTNHHAVLSTPATRLSDCKGDQGRRRQRIEDADRSFAIPGLPATSPCLAFHPHCEGSMWTVLAEVKRNFHDIRMPCETNPDCYAELNWMAEYMNRRDVRTALGVDPRAPEFVGCNMDMLVEFMAHGDGMRDTKSVVPELVHEGIRLLVYAGNTGAFALHMDYPLRSDDRSFGSRLLTFSFAQGNSRWVAELPSTHKEAFGDAPFRPWIVSGRPAGVVRSAGDGAGNVTYLTVFEAGHMVPHDQPEAALDMLNRWIRNTPLAD